MIMRIGVNAMQQYARLKMIQCFLLDERATGRMERNGEWGEITNAVIFGKMVDFYYDLYTIPYLEAA